MKLSAADHQALRSVGFTPLGPVFGNHVRRAAVGWLPCGPDVSPVLRQEDGLAKAVDDALIRLMHMSPDADGVIGIRVTEEPFGRGSEVSLTGVAVRADGAVRPGIRFLTHLGGADFAKLLHGGWVPCGLAVGVAAVAVHRVEMPRTIELAMSNRELPQPTEVLNRVQLRARAHLSAECGLLGGAGVVMGQMDVRVREPHCWLANLRPPLQFQFPWSPPLENEKQWHGRDIYAEAVFTATAITPFRAPAVAPLTIMPVGDR
ncbi:hypothetical protein [Lentzea sp. NPDC059081]|uniref:hypothetical protein n=1 Tax=Lentzea sp. NPDC059081 TaxID=3346719 RepID=UPI0036A6748C